jgi:DNA ligase (NAD+)
MQTQSFVFTGILSIPRCEAAERVQSAGGVFSDKLTKGTTYLVAGVDAGSRLMRAQQLGVTVLGEREFMALVGAKH